MARILLADDDRATRDLVKRAIEMDGHLVDVAEDGAVARSVLDIDPSQFDLLVTDIEMPGLDGLALAKHALAASPRIKVLMMSGYAEPLERGRALGGGRLDVIVKPFSLEQVRRSIAALLA